MNEKELAKKISMDALDTVVGGQGSADQEMINEFEKEWKELGLNMSGSMQSTYYSEWKLNDFTPSAKEFLKACFKIK